MTIPHPPPAELRAFHRGELADAAADAVAAHVEGCPACEAALQRLDRQEPSVVADLRGELPPTQVMDVGPPVAGPDAAGTVLAGRYLLAAVLGEGGMGTVWRAEQTEPVRRPVAVKLVKPGMDSKQVLARFAAERQALALMDHPNIARVFDAGATAAGRPFFVMELVQGVSITAYCDAHRLTPRQRLELFVPVCRAVQHAHQKGVIHRDLKPGNVLVTEVDGRPVPKVIDFGIAKATGAALTDHTLNTQLGAVVGTPEYMAPEQADPDTTDIDTRADVYALGVILYELLTGSTPLTRHRLQRAALLEILRLVREEEPPAPSSRLSTADALPSIAADRATEPRRLTGLLRGDLDWIALKALEKDRDRRYDTPAGLARDVERFLADEPVEAGRPSRAYRLRRFVRRNRAAVLTAGALALTLATAAGVSTWQAVRATRAEGRAVAERDDKQEALTRAEAAEEKAKAALLAAEKQLAARTAIEQFYNKRILQAGRPKGTDNGLGRDVSLRTTLEKAVEHIGPDLKGQPDAEALVRHKLAESFNFLDDRATALAQYQLALGLWAAAGRPDDDLDVLQTVNDIAVVLQTVGRRPEAVPLLERVLAAKRAKLPADDPKVLESMNNLSAAYYYVGRRIEALPLYEETYRLRRARLGPEATETLRSLNNLAAMYSTVGRLSESIRMFEELLAVRRRLDADPATASVFNTHMVMSNLGQLYLDAGRTADGVRILEELVPLRRENLDADHTETLDAVEELARGYAAAGRPADALGPLEELAAAARRRKPDTKRPDPLAAVTKLAHGYLAADRPRQAEAAFAEVIAVRRKQYPPDDPKLADSLATAGGALADAGRFAAAEPYLRESLAIRERVSPAAWQTAQGKSLLGGALAGLRQWAEAEPLLQAGYAGLKARAGEPPAAAKLPAAADRLVRFYTRRKNAAEADRWRVERATYPPERAPAPRPVP